MKSKLLSIFVTAMFILSSATVTLASAITSTGPASVEISMDTVITKNNINDVLKYLNIDPSTFIEESSSKKKNMTVKELESAINNAKKMDNNSILINDKKLIKFKFPKPTELTNSATGTSISTSSSTGAATVYDTTDYGDCRAVYSATGTYYLDGEEAYWTAATGTGLDISSITGSYVWKKDVKTLKSTVSFISSVNSDLVLNYDYTAKCYIDTGIGLVLVNAKTIEGSRKWNGYRYL